MLLNCNYCNIEVERVIYNKGRITCFDCKRKNQKKRDEERKLRNRPASPETAPHAPKDP